MRRLALAFILLGWAAIFGSLQGCALRDTFCGLDRPEVEVAEAAIVNGVPSTDTRSVVRLRMIGNGTFCTATKIGLYTYLTAAHCVEGETSGIRIEREGTYFGSTSNWEQHPAFGGKGLRSSKSFEGDLAVVWTDFPVPGPIATVAEAPTGCYPGLIAQGYGQDENGEYTGLNERTVYEVWHNDRTIFTTEGNCYGDSGGGLYADTPEGQTIIGVSSFVRHHDCSSARAGAAGYTNLFTYSDWVKERTF